MTATNGSPSPKPRAGRQHRHTKSGSSIASSGTKHCYQPSSKNDAIPYSPHYAPLGHYGYPNYNHASPRSNRSADSLPQTPKGQGIVSNDESSTNKRKKCRGRPRDGIATAKSVPVCAPTAPITGSQSPGPSGTGSTDQMTPPKPSTTPVKAYAGPLFHSSPNPSALPVPKFFSRPVPATPAGGSMQAITAESEDSEDASGPFSDRQAGESHLQKLFRADKEEKERLRMKRQSSGSSSSNDGFSGTGVDRSVSESNGFMDTFAPRAAKSMSGIFSMDIEKPDSSTPNPFCPSPARTSSAPSQIQSVRPKSKEEEEDESDRKATANLLKLYLLSPAALSPKHESAQPLTTPQARKPQSKAGQPLTPTRNYQNHSHSRSVTGFSPSDRSPRSLVLNDDMRMHVPGGLPPSPLALRGSPSLRRGSHLHGRQARAPKSNPMLQDYQGSQSKKSGPADKLEANILPRERTVADLENDLRRALNLDAYATRPPSVGGVLI